jgi:hypothetical protein
MLRQIFISNLATPFKFDTFELKALQEAKKLQKIKIKYSNRNEKRYRPESNPK